MLKGRRFRACIVAAMPAASAEHPNVQALIRPLLKLGFDQTRLALCAFGSPFRRDTTLLSIKVNPAALGRPCACERRHSQVRGRRAGRGPVYPWLFAYQVSEALSSGLRRLRHEDLAWEVSHEGLERLVATDLALGLRWSPLLVWDWKSGAHINILESSALVRLYTWVAVNFGRARFVNLCDSFVAQAALGKGRSSAPGLRHVSRRSGAVCLAAGLYPGNLYCPTRAMPADHPTRDAPMPPPVAGFGLKRWTEEAILRDAERPRLRRWAANWCRLVGLLVPPLVLGPWPCDCVLDSGRSPHTYGPLLDFDACLGFPGEGPSVALFCCLSALRAGLFGPTGGLVLSHFGSFGLGCNPLVQGPSMFVGCGFAPSSVQLPVAFDLGCNSLVQGPSTLTACGSALSSEPVLCAFGLGRNFSVRGFSSLVVCGFASSPKQLLGAFAFGCNCPVQVFSVLATCGFAPSSKQPFSAAGLGCNSLVQGPSTFVTCCLAAPSLHFLSALGLGCNSLVQGPSASSRCGFAPSFKQLLSAFGPGCNSLVQGPGTFVACWFAAPSEQLLRAFRLGCNSLVQGPSIAVTCGFAPSFKQLLGAFGLGCNSLVQGPRLLLPDLVSKRTSITDLGPGLVSSPSLPVQGWFGVFSLLCLSSHSPVVCLGLSQVGPAAAMDAARRATQDDRRKSRALAPLLEGRPVQALTRDRRSKLKASWIGWLADEGYTWNDVGRWARDDVSKLNQVLSRYGKWLYEDGWPYYWLSETINMVSSEFPTVRRFLQQVWDLAQAWQREEPPTHHSALPWQVLAALLSVSITWGWIRVAGAIALAWGGLARIGEVLAARRKHLVLPADTGDDAQVVYMSVMEPKTRFRAARHQCLKVDQPQLVRLICLAFESLDPEEKLWLMSPSTLRARFDKLLAALTLTRNLVPGVKDFDLGSLRAGGATWMMQVTESPDLVRRRGRWVSNRIMEIYVQEVSALMYLPRLPPDKKNYIYQWANSLNSCLDAAAKFSAYKLPPCHWHALLRQGVVMP